jgi:hypothetical protein
MKLNHGQLQVYEYLHTYMFAFYTYVNRFDFLFKIFSKMHKFLNVSLVYFTSIL